MRLALVYGTDGLSVDLDESRFEPTVIVPRDPPDQADSHAAFLDAVRHPYGDVLPLAELARRMRPRRVVIAIADHTRPVPDQQLVPWIVDELGVPDEAVTLLVGTGTHRGSTPAELERKLGAAARRFRVENHDCTAEGDHVRVGTSGCGGECWLDRRWVEAELRLCTGFVEPHFWAGFSGGAKAVVPGLAGIRTIRHFHRSSLIAHPCTTWGETAHNPLLALSREWTALCPPHFIVNVTLNLRQRITGVFAGELVAAHDAGCAQARQEAMQPVARRFPAVVTTNSGHPLDQNFYQTTKGISAACRIVEPGGTVLVASRCSAGLPSEGEFRAQLADPRPTPELLAAILATTETRYDQWAVQSLLQSVGTAEVILFSELCAADRALTRTGHTDDLAASLEVVRQRRGGGRLPVAVLPMGPLTIPYIASDPVHGA
jgi:hypothetical protein